MIETKPREIKIKERVHYALSKKVLKIINWETGDLISQHADITCPYAISLFNTSLWKRVAGNSPDMIDLAVKQSEERNKDYEQMERKYKKESKRCKKRALNKFNKGTIKEEDLKKEQIKFSVAATNAQLKHLRKHLNKRKRLIKKN